MTMFPKLLGGYSGTMVENMGYSSFFIMTALLTIPVLILIPIAGRFLAKAEDIVQATEPADKTLKNE